MGRWFALLFLCWSWTANGQLPPENVPPTYRDWIARHPEIRFAADPAWHPLEFIDPQGRHAGIGADYLTLLEKRLGLRFVLVPTTSWRESLAKARRGEVDLLPLLNATPERERDFRFTQPYFESPVVILVRRSTTDIQQIADLDQRTVAMVEGYAYQARLANQPGVMLRPRPDIATTLTAVATGEVDAAVMDLAVASYWIERLGLTNLKAAAEFDPPNRLAMATRPDWPLLPEILQWGLGQIGPEQHRAIRREWIALAQPHEVTRTLQLTPAETAWLQAHPVIRMGGETDWAPFDFVDEQGRHTGISANYFHLLEQRLGVRIDVDTRFPWAQTLQNLRDGKLDAVANIVRTPERDQYLRFSEPYFSLPYVIITRRDAPPPNLERFQDQSVAVERDFFIHEKLRAQYPQIPLVVVENTLGALHAVSQERADAYIGNLAVTSWLIEHHLLTNLKIAAQAPFPGSLLRLGVREDLPLLQSILNKGLADITPGEQRAIRRRWLATENDWLSASPKVILSPAEKAWLNDHNPIRLGVDPDFAPFEFMDENGQYGGIASDYVRLLRERVGVELEVVPNLTWPEVMQQTRLREIDVLAAVGRNAERESYLRFTTPYLESPTVIFTRVDAPFVGGVEDLDGLTVAMKESSFLHQRLDPRRDLTVITVPTTLAALRAVADGQADAHINTLANGGYVIEKYHLNNVKVAAPFGQRTESLGFAVRDDWPELVSILNKGLASIANAEAAEIRRKWISVRYEYGIDMRGVIWRVVAGGAVVAVIVLLVLLSNRRLQREIQQREHAETEMREARRLALEASAAKSQFLANMSHEIRTPMNAIIGMCYLALQTDLDDRQRDYLGKIQSASHTLLGLINDVLDFSKIEAGKLEMEAIPFQLDEIFSKLSHLLSMKAEQKGLELLFHADPAVPRALVGDPLRLGQVLTNLVNNALKFTEEGEIEVKAEVLNRQPHQVELHFTVRDTGIGIPLEIQRQLFAAFTQADGSTTRQYGGTGLGLSICKMLVEKMHGAIHVESTPGQGSTFWFTAMLGLQTADTAPTLPRELSAKRVLVVDDNATARDILRATLESWGCQVDAVASGEAALATLRHEPGSYDLMLLDWMMPGLDGLETARHVRDDEKLPQPPAIIMVTAYGSEEVMKAAKEAGLDGFLVKPINASTLLDTLTNVLGDHPGSSAVAMQPANHPKLQGRVLLVEDNLINQQVAKELLHSAGLQVRVAHNGREAVEAVQSRPFDLVLMDIQMPIMDGYEATRKIRAEARFADLPIIAMTAHVLEDEQAHCQAVGMRDHLAKPIDPEVLFTKLAQWLPEAPPGAVASSGEDPSAVPLPEPNPVFDTARALVLTNQNRALLDKLLHEFQRDHRDDLDHIRAALDEENPALARRLAHTLAGVAGNLAALPLHNAARGLENTILRHPEDPERLREALAPCDHALAEFLAAVDSSLVPLPGETPPAQIPPEFQQQLTHLQSLLDTGDADALALAQALARANTPHAALLAQVHANIEAFEFDQAARLLAEIAPTTLKSRTKPSASPA